MPFVQFTEVSLAFGARDLLKGASLFLQDGTRAALAGPNGAGKSTLMKIAAGLIKPDSGERAATRGARISYLPQTGAVVGGGTVYEEAESAFDFVRALLARHDEIGALLQHSRADDRATARLLEELESVSLTVEQTGYHRRRERVQEVLRGLGFRLSDLNRRALDLSGGWQMRLALARILLEDPDVMLMDEPTNYLDLEARTWLEEFLAAYRGGVLVVSHDRYFLDVTIREVYELFNGRLSRYPGTYSDYESRRSRELDQIFEAWDRQQEEIQKLEDFIRRFRYKESKAAQVQSRIKMLEKIVPVEIPEGMKHIHFKFPDPPRSGRVPVKVEGLRKAYGDNLVIAGLDLEIERGAKMAFVGPNGAGKSTLMRIIAGADTRFEGTVKFGSGVEVAWFAQDTAEKMEGSHSVEQEAESVCPDALLPKLRNLLGAFLFRGDDIEKPVSVLSGGERSRLALLKMLMHPANLLVLDEPTNHLDLTSKDVLLEALKAFDGTVLFVSHDRGFIEELADRVLELEAGAAPRLYVGDYRYYLDKKASLAPGAAGPPSGAQAGAPPFISAVSAATIAASASPSPSTSTSTSPSPSPSNPTPIPATGNWEEDKARKAALRKLRKREEEIGARLDTISARKRDLERDMADPRFYSDGAAMKKLLAEVGALDAEAATLNDEWLKVAEALGSEG